MRNRAYLVEYHKAILEKGFWLSYCGLGSIADFDAMTIEERDWNFQKLKEVKEEEKKKQDEVTNKTKSAKSSHVPKFRG